MRIFHTGDVHLDTPFSGLGVSQSAKRRSELRDTFSRMMKYASESGADMVIISGDLFDRDFVTRDTVTLLKSEFSRLRCPVIITPGNHDPATQDSIWMRDLFPENVHVFKKDELEVLHFDSLSCDVYGFAFTSPVMTECPADRKKVMDPDKVNILAAHGDTTSPIGNNCPMTPALLRSFGADYCALGHIHNPSAANAELCGIGAYCGCPEGRDFGETGAKGALLVDITKTDGEATVKVVPVKFSKRVYEVVRVDVTGASSADEIVDRLNEETKKRGFGEDTLVRYILTGSVDTQLSVDEVAVSKMVTGTFFTEVKDSTAPTWNSEVLEKDRGIKGEVYRVLLPLLLSEDADEREKGAAALKYALAALNGDFGFIDEAK